jgi:hypothetical protein
LLLLYNNNCYVDDKSANSHIRVGELLVYTD